MKNYTCHKCKCSFTVNNPNWDSVPCPNCGVRNFNPDKVEHMGNQAAMAIVKIILGAILIGVVFATMIA